MNYINDPWIPVIRRDSQRREIIRPFDITDKLSEDPFLSIDMQRPDFDGSLIQFLIGIIQTVMTPTNEENWLKLFEAPPSSEELYQSMKDHLQYFNLEGAQNRFMQESDLESAKTSDISALLLNYPGENTIQNNTDHFIKRASVTGMCPSCTGMALYTLQNNATSGGAGNRTSLRGGGPLTTIIIPDGHQREYNTLWHTIWLNIILEKDLEKTHCNRSLHRISAIYPWTSAIRISDTNAVPVTAEEIHPLQTFWGMPRRIKLHHPDKKTGVCDICGKTGTALYRAYDSKPHGIQYGEGILHPLSPYYADKQGLQLPVHPQPGGFTYRHWSQYIVSSSVENPRSINLQILDRRLHDLQLMGIFCGVKVKVFGYDAKNMTIRCWYETTMPYWLVPEPIRAEFEDHANRLAEAALQIAQNTKEEVKNLLVSEKSKAGGNLSYLEKEFWSATEEMYYGILRSIQEAQEAQSHAEQDLYRKWNSLLNKTSLQIFDRYAEQIPFDSVDKTGIPRKVTFRDALIKKNMGRKIRVSILGLSQ